MSLGDYKVVLHRSQPEGWVAAISAIEGCFALLPAREQVLAELANVFFMIEAERREAGRATAITHA